MTFLAEAAALLGDADSAGTLCWVLARNGAPHVAGATALSAAVISSPHTP